MYLVFGEGKETICPHELRKVAVDEFVHSYQEPLTVEEVPHLLYVNIALENITMDLRQLCLGLVL